MLLDFFKKKKIDVRVFDGSLSMIDDFNDGKIKVLLLQPASAGHGINLQYGGSTLVWYTLPWSLEYYEQTNARFHRQGQTSPVIIHHLLCDGTVDTAVLRAIKNKKVSQDGLLDAVKACFD